MTAAARTRLSACAYAMATVAAGLGIRAAATGPVAKYAGDALYALLVFWLVLAVAPRLAGRTAALAATGLCWAVEFFQLTGLPADWGRGSALARLVLGTTFNAPDLAWYAAGAALGWLLYAVTTATLGTRSTRRGSGLPLPPDPQPTEGTGMSETPEQRRETLLSTWPQWRKARDEAFAAPYSALSLTALHWLEPGEPSTFDGVPGVWTASGDGVTVTAEPGDGLTVAGAPVSGPTPITLTDTSSGQDVKYGDVVIEVIERGGDFAFRVRDPKAPALLEFTGVPAYEPSPQWIVDGVFEPFEEPREMTIGTVVDGLTGTEYAVGTVRFQVGGEDCALTVFGDGGLYALFRDATSGVTTNPSARVLDIEPPYADGRVLLDFTRARNLPCAFNDYSTCPVPPYENRLTVAIEAGEKKPA